jgi:hypothetical protein
MQNVSKFSTVAALLFAAAATADTSITKKPDLGNFWNPVGANSSYVYANLFIAPNGADITPAILGTWLDDQGSGGSNIRLEVWGDNGGPDASNVIASTGTVYPGTSGLTYVEYPASGGSVTPGQTYWFVITGVGEVGPGGYQTGGHTQNSVYQDNGTFWYSNDPAGISFDGQNLTPEMAFNVVLTPGGVSSNYYLRSEAGQPWGQSTNEAAMKMVFGGDWIDGTFESQDPNTLFSDATDFIYIDGSDNGAEEFAKFIAVNQTAMEKWVSAGGRLLLNSAPNEGESFDMGFGHTLVYPDFGNELHVIDPGHPVANGPFTPAGPDYTGTSASHASVKGNSVAISLSELGSSSITELAWDSGAVIFGGLTTDNFWSPQPEAANFRANLISYASRGGDEECYADFTQDGLLDLFDFLAYVNAYNAGEKVADCDANGGLDLFDFLCFVNAFNAGC